jgi:nicotinamide-nucleotide amidase
MESCTGGLLSSLITDYPGSSNYFLGGIVAYFAAVKAAHGVERHVMDRYGLISPETSLAMARAARLHFGADVGLGVSGIAGAEPVEDKLPGTCFVASHLDGSGEVREIHRPAQREVAKNFFALCALDLLRRELHRRTGMSTSA